MNDSRVHGICMVNGNIVAENGPVRSAVVDASTDARGESAYSFRLNGDSVVCVGLDSDTAVNVSVGTLSALAVACDSSTWSVATQYTYRSPCPNAAWRQWARKTRLELDI